MEVLDASRWQFGVTTVYHFLFVPLTIGLSFLVAGFQTAWYRTGNERWLKLTKFYGKLFLINFAMGVVTGIVQEFQFGMNWSAYSRYVGDIFGAPLAIEGLLAFFLESTFLGLWIFGWDRLPKKIHLACIWIAAAGTAMSAYFILAANSFMQWPVGYRLNAETGRAELVDFMATMTNKVALITFPHTLFGCFLTAGALIMAVALWHLYRKNTPDDDRKAFRSAAKMGAITTLIAMAGMFVTGDIQGKIMTETQPMKMAAAEALYETEQPADFSLFTIGSLDGTEEVYALKVPDLLSFLATGTFDGKVLGINDVQKMYEEQFGPGDYRPNIPVTYWSFRGMIGFGALAALIALWVLWSMRKGRTPASRLLKWLVPFVPLMPLAGNSLGWIFTEMGRQPWIVFSLLKTADGVSPTVTLAQILTSFIVFTVLYGTLAVVEVGLLLKYAKAGLPDVTPPPPSDDTPDGEDKPLAFAY
ncbi:cytochrome ubiquinol oxidase subunit I [Actinorhabdospora filicis]|uniref:Cytochrome ubiquinol oxidase subunit I n=1 Tax=Actinorhabdospora filicis TaxID=1785913 RepID=A0A9W6WAN1_9ACTN|nr:cytochrome ubiquinol oxidase subunit I [Actinorhabdospora filicis]GLZ79178.1 cytochrome ubiquinol oxidase subunit I [Actinorhabdospora filicis]